MMIFFSFLFVAFVVVVVAIADDFAVFGALIIIVIAIVVVVLFLMFLLFELVLLLLLLRTDIRHNPSILTIIYPWLGLEFPQTFLRLANLTPHYSQVKSSQQVGLSP